MVSVNGLLYAALILQIYAIAMSGVSLATPGTRVPFTIISIIISTTVMGTTGWAIYKLKEEVGVN